MGNTVLKLFAHHHHGNDRPWDEAPHWALELAAIGLAILANQEKLMATIDQVLADVTDESTRLDSISTLIDGLKTQLADALAGTTLSPAVQSKVDAVFAAAEANKAKIDKALNTNVPAPAPAG